MTWRECDQDGTFIGPMMVAKESRFIEEVNNDDLKQFHAAFCKTQQKANRIAVEFNKRLAMIPGRGLHSSTSQRNLSQF
jgi:hypothetical protein